MKDKKTWNYDYHNKQENRGIVLVGVGITLKGCFVSFLLISSVRNDFNTKRNNAISNVYKMNEISWCLW